MLGHDDFKQQLGGLPLIILGGGASAKDRPLRDWSFSYLHREVGIKEIDTSFIWTHYVQSVLMQ